VAKMLEDWDEDDEEGPDWEEPEEEMDDWF
jgi:hypothetical protein